MSVADTVNLTFSFVHSVVFAVSCIVGPVLSILLIVISCCAMFPALSLTYIVYVPFAVIVNTLLLLQFVLSNEYAESANPDISDCKPRSYAVTVICISSLVKDSVLFSIFPIYGATLSILLITILCPKTLPILFFT